MDQDFGRGLGGVGGGNCNDVLLGEGGSDILNGGAGGDIIAGRIPSSTKLAGAAIQCSTSKTASISST